MADLTASLVPLNHKLYKHFKGFSAAYTIGPKNFLYPSNGPKILNKLQTFQARDDDVGVVTFLKTGTTWMQEIVYLLRNNCDVEKAKSLPREDVFPYADINTWEWNCRDAIAYLNDMESPRNIKFHVQYSLLPPQTVERSKIIYVCRNVKDTIVSSYHFYRGIEATNFQGSLEDFADLFMENNVPYAPYFAHIREFWERRHEKNIFFTTYEDMHKDQEKVISDVAKFLNIPVRKEDVEIVANHCQFDNLKKIPTANKTDWDSDLVHRDFVFMRKGKVGSWNAEMSPQLVAKVNKWIHEETIDYPHFRDIL